MVYKNTVLIVDDDPNVFTLIQQAAQPECWTMLNLGMGGEAIRWIDENRADLVILDIGLPDISGIEVCRHIAKENDIPIMMLSGRAGLVDKITCLDFGADDYLTKPFSVDELLTRAKAIMRRSSKYKGIINCYDDHYLEINIDAKVVKIKGIMEKLTRIEYKILEELLMNRGKVVNYRDILHKVWGSEYFEDDKGSLQAHICNLRAKIEKEPEDPQYIICVPGIGYRFNELNSNS